MGIRFHWEWSSISKPAFGIAIPIPFTHGDYSFSFYFRYRPQAYRVKTGNGLVVIDWPWVSYTGWRNAQGQKCPSVKVSN